MVCGDVTFLVHRGHHTKSERGSANTTRKTELWKSRSLWW